MVKKTNQVKNSKATGTKQDKKQIKQKEIEEESLSLNEENSSSVEELSQNETNTNTEPKSRRIKKIEGMLEGMELTTGVLYVSHLPWGTNEDLIKKYFEQFGAISRFILPRSKRTGRIKGYAFIEFESMEIASIAAKTMNNFILFDRILKCDVVSDKTRYNKIFKRWKRQFKFFNKYNKFVLERNKKKTPKEMKEAVQLLLEKEDKKRMKLKELGINYSFPGYKKLVDSHKK